MDAPTIDLARWKAPLETFLEKGIARFTKKHPKTAVSAMGIYYAGLNPGLYLTFDTRANSDAEVAAGGDYVKRDKHGRFHAHAYDFAYNVGDFGFEGFPNLYEFPWQFKVRLPDGKTAKVDFDEDGDDGLNKVMLRFLVSVLKPFNGYKSLARDKPFRVVIAMHNSEYGKAWVVE